MGRRGFLLSACFLWAVVPFARADGWKAGVARATITPREPMWMAGYASRTGPSEGAVHDLWCKALALEDQGGSRAVLVSLDLCGVARPLSAEVREEVRTKYGLDQARIVLACSHTHTGPVTRDNLITMYGLNEEQARKVQEYSKVLHRTIVDTVGKALEALAPVNLAWGTGRADFAVNRRENKEADVPKLREAVALKGPNDFDVPVLKVSSNDGALKAIVFGYACHCTVLGFNQFTGDYAGFAQIDLEKAHPGTTALFVAGCGADQNPLPRRTVELARDYGSQLALAVEKVLSGPMPAVGRGLRVSYEEVNLPFAALPARADWEREAASSNVSLSQRAKMFLTLIDAGQPVPSTCPYPVQAWRIGEDLTWVLLGGEVVVDYALRLKRNFGPSTTWVSSYCNDVMAYVPSERVLAEGGYEGDSSMIPYGLPSKWAPGIEDQIIEAVARRVRSLKAP